MAVVESQRSQGDLDVIIKAKELAKHTLQVTQNEKYFPKRYRFTIANKLVDKAFDIFILLYEANEIYPQTVDEWKMRRTYQRRAMAYCRSLIAVVDICKDMFGLPSNKVAYWAKLTFEVRNKTAAWLKSDNNRFKEKFNK